MRDLTLGVEFRWTNHHASHGDGVVCNQPVISGFKPNAAYAIRDQNVFSGQFWVRRFSDRGMRWIVPEKCQQFPDFGDSRAARRS